MRGLRPLASRGTIFDLLKQSPVPLADPTSTRQGSASVINAAGSGASRSAGEGQQSWPGMSGGRRSPARRVARHASTCHDLAATEKQHHRSPKASKPAHNHSRPTETAQRSGLQSNDGTRSAAGFRPRPISNTGVMQLSTAASATRVSACRSAATKETPAQRLLTARQPAHGHG